MLRKPISTINEKDATYLRQWGIGVAVIFFLTFLFFSSFVRYMSYPLELSHGDAFLVNFILNHYVEIFTTGNWSSLSTLPMFYGFPHSLFFTEFYPVHGVVAFILSFFTPNIFLISNVFILATVLFSTVSMYTFCWYVFRRIGPSIVGALIFTFNPFLMARFPDHALLLAVGWIPASLLFVERAIREPKGNNVFLLFLVLVAQLLTSSLHYSIFLTVILPIYIGIRVWQEKVPLKLFLHISTFVGVAMFVIVATTVGFLYIHAYGTESLGRTLETSYTYSARVTDWLFTAPSNIVYGGLKAYWADRLPQIVRLGIYSEQNLFTGVIPTMLAITCIVLFKKLKQKKVLMAIAVIGSIAWVLSFGPQIVINDTANLPGLYGFIYQINPLFSYLRVPARFGIFVFLAIGVFSTAVLSRIGRAVSPWVFRILLLCVIMGILVEYWQKPIEVTRVSSDMQAAYAPLKSREDIQVILNLPIGNSINYSYTQARGEDLDARYLLWALLVHDKQLFNGYSGYLPKEYYKRANALSIAFPTRGKVIDLKRWGVGAIVLHRDEFNDPAHFENISAGLQELGVKKLSETHGVVIFDLATWREAQ